VVEDKNICFDFGQAIQIRIREQKYRLPDEDLCFSFDPSSIQISR